MHRLADEMQQAHPDWAASLSRALLESVDRDLTEVYGVELTFHCS